MELLFETIVIDLCRFNSIKIANSVLLTISREDNSRHDTLSSPAHQESKEVTEFDSSLLGVLGATNLNRLGDVH